MTEQQYKKLYHRLSSHAFNNSSPALKLLIGFCLKQGLGSTQNLQQARTLFEEAAQEDQDAYHQLCLLDQSIKKTEWSTLASNRYQPQVFNAQSEAHHLNLLTNPQTSIELCLELLEFFKQVLNEAEKIPSKNQDNAEKATKFYLESKNYYLKGLESTLSENNDNQKNKYIKNRLIELEACKTYASIKNIFDHPRLKKTHNPIVDNITESLPNHLTTILNTINKCYVSRSPVVFSITDDQKNQLQKQLDWLQAGKKLLALKATKAKFKPVIQKIDDCLSLLHTCLETIRQYAPADLSGVVSAPTEINFTTDLARLVNGLAALDTTELSSLFRQVQAELTPIQEALPIGELPKI